MPPRTATARRLVLDAERRFRRARLWFGHGTDNARDEAVFLVFHALGLPFDVAEAELDREVDAGLAAQAEALIAERIATRRPAAYLTGRMWFAGHEFKVDERVLIPRSPIGELIRERFVPWLDPQRVRRVLDVGTGSGCIAIATALALPHCTVDATDISGAALAVARDNAVRLGVASRVRFHQADLFPKCGEPWDLIVANPPYVPRAEYADLPAEYLREPRDALVAGEDGLEIVRRLLAGLPERMSDAALLVLDTGGSSAALAENFPHLPFTWVELAHGGDGISVLTRRELVGA